VSKEKNNTTGNYSTEIPAYWEIKELSEVIDFLDGKRTPIKGSDMNKMQG
jgi:hypothetical protein